MYRSTEALRKLVGTERTEASIIRISPRGYTVNNGVEYCYVGIRSRDGTEYSISAYGKEAIGLYNEATKLR